MKRTIILLIIIISSGIIIYSCNEDNLTNNSGKIESNRASVLVCCNNVNPWTWPGGFGDEPWSYFCYVEGEQVEISIPGRCCAQIWALNNYQNPVGLPCPNCK